MAVIGQRDDDKAPGKVDIGDAVKLNISLYPAQEETFVAIRYFDINVEAQRSGSNAEHGKVPDYVCRHLLIHHLLMSGYVVPAWVH